MRKGAHDWTGEEPTTLKEKWAGKRTDSEGDVHQTWRSSSPHDAPERSARSYGTSRPSGALGVTVSDGGSWRQMVRRVEIATSSGNTKGAWRIL
jgi:hypothetical protein